MAEKERIINKLKNYLLKNMGFKADGESISKSLKNTKDFIISDYVVMNILNGKAYGGEKKYIYSLIEENFISEIEEKFTDFLNLTDKEKTYLDADDDGCYGFDEISEWIWDNVHVDAEKSRVDMLIDKMAKRNAVQQKVA